MEGQTLHPDEVSRILDVAQNQNQRNYLLIKTMVLTGLSRAEVVRSDDARSRGLRGLRIEDFRWDEHRALVQRRKNPYQKGPRTEWVEFRWGLSDEIRQYCGDRKKGIVFHYSTDGLSKLFQACAKDSGIAKHVNTRMLQEFHDRYLPILPEILGLEFNQDYFERKIKEGENDRVEWKAAVTDGQDFCETLVSFANLNGGIILLGVSNEGKVVGLPGANWQKVEEQITNLDRELCQPFVHLTLRPVQFHSKDVAIVRVNEGSDKPYWLKDRGPMIRNGSSDRLMSRPEVEQVFRSKFQRK